jgi:glutamate 5-kinase
MHASSDTNPSPRGALEQVRSVVVKLGTQLLSKGGGDRTLDTAFISDMAAQIAALRTKGVRVTVVSSGAVGAGMARLKLAKRPDDLATLQAVAAVGQPRLMTAWSEALAPHGLSAAQILLTREDIDHRTRFLNLRNTLAAADALGAVPVINENDTVSTDEMVRISFGDNDLLAALVTQAIRAELLVLLTVVDGVLDAGGKPVRLVASVADARALVRKEKSAAGKGGMDSKVKAADIVTSAGEMLVVANGRTPDILSRILTGDEVGTLFIPAGRRKTGRTRWISSARPSGTLTIDDGAAKALSRGDRSLLPAGITGVSGEFDPGDVVEITDAKATPLARGLSNYSAAQIRLIRGKRSSEVRKLLADSTYDEVVHRDNMALLVPQGHR